MNKHLRLIVRCSVLIWTVTTTLYGDAIHQMVRVLDGYKEYLDKGTYEGADCSYYSIIPATRYYTLKAAFTEFIKNNGRVIVELGTTRSFVHGGLVGCNSDNPIYWTPNNPERWDWGAGSFTRVVAESLSALRPIIYTVDLEAAHINRCKIITADYASIIRYHVASSVDFLKNFPHDQKIDLLYMDTGDMWPIQHSIDLHLEEAKIIVELDLIATNGIILIDDVRNGTPRKFGSKDCLGKDSHAIPYLLSHGFKVVAHEYQMILQKVMIY